MRPERWSKGLLASSIALPIAMLVLGRHGMLTRHERQGYVIGAGVLGGHVLMITASVVLALLGLLLAAVALRIRPTPRAAGRKWRLLTFLLVPAAWYLWWGDVYAWLLRAP